MKKIISLIILCLIFTGCSRSYLCSINTSTAVYEKPDSSGKPVFFLTYGKNAIVDAPQKGYRKVSYGNKTGYIVKTRFANEIRISQKERKTLHFDHDSTYAFKRYKTMYPEIFEESKTTGVNSTSGSRQSSTSSGSKTGEVHVRGYYRSNGTYVQPHTRSAPRR